MKICKLEICDDRYYAKGYCRRHYMQIYRRGKIIDKKYLPNFSTFIRECREIESINVVKYLGVY
jgi:hypothetical protein